MCFMKACWSLAYRCFAWMTFASQIRSKTQSVGAGFFSSQREVIRAPQGTKQMFLTFGQRMPKKAALPRQVLWNARWSIDFSFCF